MRILGITIPDDKQLEFGLAAIFGIGSSNAKKILTTANIEHSRKAKDLSEEEENKIRALVEGLSTEGNLKREIAANIKRLKDIKSYRGTIS